MGVKTSKRHSSYSYYAFSAKHFLNIRCGILTKVARGIWDSVELIQPILCTFDLLGFKVIWGSFNALVTKWPVTQNDWPQSKHSSQSPQNGL